MTCTETLATCTRGIYRAVLEGMLFQQVLGVRTILRGPPQLGVFITDFPLDFRCSPGPVKHGRFLDIAGASAGWRIFGSVP